MTQTDADRTLDGADRHQMVYGKPRHISKPVLQSPISIPLRIQSLYSSLHFRVCDRGAVWYVWSVFELYRRDGLDLLGCCCSSSSSLSRWTVRFSSIAPLSFVLLSLLLEPPDRDQIT